MTTVDPTEFGLDVSCVGDLDPTAREVTGLEALMQAQLRRLDTPRGALDDDEDYGYDLASLVSKGMTAEELAAVPARVAAELTKDARISSVQTTVVLLSASAIRLKLRMFSSLGPFTTTVEISGAAAVILDLQSEAA